MRENSQDGLTALGFEGHEIHACTVTHDGRILVQGAVEGKGVTLLLDTGFSDEAAVGMK